MPAVISQAVADVSAAVEKLRADDAVITDPEMLLGDAEALLDAVTSVQAVVVRRLADAQAVDATGELYGRGTKRWLVEDQLQAGPDASRLMRIVRHGADHPATMAAHASARITTAHAAAIVTALRTLPVTVRDTVEPHLIDRAMQCPPEEIAGFVDELLERLGIDKPGDRRREHRYASRGVDVATTMNGTRSLSGTLTPEVGEKLESALALAAQKTGPEDERTPRQRRHDALGVIADTFLGAASEPSFTGAPRTVIVTMDLETLEGRLREQLIALPGGRISAETARRLACDAAIIPAVLGGNGEILDIGQAGHEFSAAVRRAAWIRDGGRCAFPKCRNRCLELHHIIFRRHGGDAGLHNAAWLCAYHHWLVHEGGWTLARAPHGGYLWTGPFAQVYERHL